MMKILLIISIIVFLPLLIKNVMRYKSAQQWILEISPVSKTFMLYEKHCLFMTMGNICANGSLEMQETLM